MMSTLTMSIIITILAEIRHSYNATFFAVRVVMSHRWEKKVRFLFFSIFFSSRVTNCFSDLAVTCIYAIAAYQRASASIEIGRSLFVRPKKINNFKFYSWTTGPYHRVAAILAIHRSKPDPINKMCLRKMYFRELIWDAIERERVNRKKRKRQFVAITISKSPKIPPTNVFVFIQLHNVKKGDFFLSVGKKSMRERQVFYCLFSHISV